MMKHDAQSNEEDQMQTANDLRPSTPNSRRRLTFGVLAVLVALLTLAVWAYTPEIMNEEIANRVENRLGLPFDFDGIDLGTESVSLTGVRMASPDGEAEILIDELRIDGDLLALARRDAGAIDTIRAAGATVRLDLDHPAAADRVASLRRLIERDQDQESDEETESEETAPEKSALAEFDPLLRLIRDGGKVRIVSSTVVYVEQGLEQIAFEKINGRWVKHGARDFELRGKATHAGAPLDWNVRADLESRTAEAELGWSAMPIEMALRALDDLPLVHPAATRTSGRVRIKTLEDDRLALAGRVEVDELGIESARLAQDPIRHLSGAVEGEATLELATRKLLIDNARLMSRGAEAVLTGELMWAEDAYLVDLEAELPRTACHAVVNAIPDDLLGEFAGFDMGGQMAGSLKLYVDSARLKATELDIDIDDDCLFERVPFKADLDRFKAPFYHVARGRGGEIVHEFETGPGTYTWTPIEQVSPFFLQAVLAHEDAGFFRHSGFAVYAMESALERNLREKRYVVGASTLSMQLAKNLFLERDKTLARKAQEVMLTWWLEHSLSKQEILELYVNVIEYGPEIFGIRDAAQHYFGRHPLDLTPAESVYLATSLPSPVPSHRQYEEGRLWPNVEREMRFLLRHMARKGRLNEVALYHGLQQLDRFEFHYGDHPRGVEYGLGQPGALPFETEYVERQRQQWWQVSEHTPEQQPTQPTAVFASGR